MKKILLAIFIAVLFSLSAMAAEKEITLFDSDGQAVAYIALDNDLNIYLWKGQPVAYLKKEAGEVHIYGFNGDHLGWYEKGIVWNHKGRAVGFVEGAVTKLTKFEPLKGLRKMTPLKALEKLAPMKPVLKDEFSDCPLKGFLLMGMKDL
jgi:hypothetical protein